MNPLLIILIALMSAFVGFSLLWVYQKRTGDAGIVDVAWSASVGIIAACFCLSAIGGNQTRRFLVAGLALLWAGRLSWHVYQRLQKHSEDGRYVEMKQKWGEQTDKKMFRFYQFQAFVAVLFALPMLIAAWNPTPFGILDVIGIAIWFLALAGEAIADRQLDSFRNNPSNKGQVCKRGRWRFSRHPNYFFEWIHWWSYVFLAISYPIGWFSIVAPFAMLFFILRVTGIPPTERQALKSRGDLYRDYQRTTSAFFPWFPKSTSIY